MALKYNRCLDRMAMAVAHVRKGNHEMAARYLMKAAEEPDADAALETIEVTNAQAFADMQAEEPAEELDSTADPVDEDDEEFDDEVDASEDDLEDDEDGEEPPVQAMTRIMTKASPAKPVMKARLKTSK